MVEREVAVEREGRTRRTTGRRRVLTLIMSVLECWAGGESETPLRTLSRATVGE